MHFRLRKNVVQLVRTLYNPDTKKPRAVVVGSMLLKQPSVSAELRSKLTEDEVAEAEEWIEGQFRMNKQHTANNHGLWFLCVRVVQRAN